jgi:hypothetical protein
MSHRSLATAAGAGAVDPAALAAARAPSLRIPDRFVLDMVALLDAALVVGAAVLAKLLYIRVFLESPQDYGLYVVAGLAGGLVTCYALRTHGLYERAAILEWPRHRARCWWRSGSRS